MKSIEWSIIEATDTAFTSGVAMRLDNVQSKKHGHGARWSVQARRVTDNETSNHRLGARGPCAPRTRRAPWNRTSGSALETDPLKDSTLTQISRLPN